MKILSSVGLDPFHISGIYMTEALLIGVVAGGLGYLLGLGLYPLMKLISVAPVVQQKISAFWSIAALGISVTSVVFGLLLSLQRSVVLTPSHRRRWSFGLRSPSREGVWDIPLPLKIEEDQREDLIEFISSSLQALQNPQSSPYVMRFQSYSDEGDWVFRFSFGVGQISMGDDWTMNMLRIERGPSGTGFFLTLKSSGEKKGVQSTGTYIRNLLMRWSTNRTSESQLHSDT